MREQFEKLSKRDRWAVLGGGGFLIIILFYLFVWSPFVTAISNQHARVRTQQSVLNAMQAQGGRVARLCTFGFRYTPNDGKTPLLSQVNAAFQSDNLSRYFLVAPVLKGQTVVMELGDVPFDKLMTTLDVLWKTSDIVVSELKVIQRPTPGAVNAMITVVQK